jgi:hypothetical protein
MSEIDQIGAELQRAVTKFPTWPTDPFHALAVLGEEYGELQKAVLQHTYEPHKGVTMDDIRSEAIQTAAMAIRWITSIDRYRFEVGEQHAQAVSPPTTHPLLAEARELLSDMTDALQRDGDPAFAHLRLMARALIARIDGEG